MAVATTEPSPSARPDPERDPRPGSGPPSADDPGASDDRNEVRLVGRVSAAPEVRALPSGDEVVELRVVCRRPDGSRVDSVPVVVGPPPPPRARRRPGQARRADLRRAAGLQVDERVEVEGWVQRRFWASPGGRRTRLQVVATSVRRA